MREVGVGRAVPRTEDWRLLRGGGRYTDDIALPRETRLYVLRSPHAAARIRSIDTATALDAPGVLTIVTGEDVVKERFGTFASRVTRQRPDGRPNFVPPYRPLAVERAHHVGEPVAAVVAGPLDQAKDAAELIEVGYETLPYGTDPARAANAGPPRVWAEAP